MRSAPLIASSGDSRERERFNTVDRLEDEVGDAGLESSFILLLLLLLLGGRIWLLHKIHINSKVILRSIAVGMRYRSFKKKSLMCL